MAAMNAVETSDHETYGAVAYAAFRRGMSNGSSIRFPQWSDLDDFTQLVINAAVSKAVLEYSHDDAQSRDIRLLRMTI